MGTIIVDTPGGQIVLDLAEIPSGGDGSQAMLTQADLAYLGYYDVAHDLGGGDLNYGQGFTHRRVAGQLYFLTTNFLSSQFHLLEFPKPASFGDMVTTTTNVWWDAYNGSQGWSNNTFFGLRWDEETGELWSTQGIDYPANPEDVASTVCFTSRKLNGDGSVSDFRGLYGLQGISPRVTYGGAVRIPEWFQTAYGVGPVGIGFGGYSSLMGLGCSLGPTLYSIPEPTGFADGTVFTSEQFKALMSCVSGVGGTDWYADEAPTTFDRGVRNSDVTNDFDGGNWLSPSPDGLGRWVWGDSNWNTGVWINGPNKQGFITVPTLCSGRAFYQTVGTNTLERERYSYEIQVFDPAHLGEVANGTRQPWAVKPSSRWEIQPEGLYTTTPGEYQGSNLAHGIVGATFDEVDGILYLYATWPLNPESLNSRIYAYQVNS